MQPKSPLDERNLWPKLRPGFHLFQSKSADLWASAMFGIAHAGALFSLVAISVGTLHHYFTVSNLRRDFWIERLLSILLLPPIALLWLGTIGSLILWLFSKSAPEPRTPAGWVTLGAAAGGVVFFFATLPGWTRITLTEQLAEACLVLMAGTATCQAGGAWGVNRALRTTPPNTKKDARRFRFSMGNLLWLTLNASLFFFMLRLLQTRYEAFLPLAALWLIFQFASLAMGAAVAFCWRETLALQLYKKPVATDESADDVPRGTEATPAD